MHKNSIRSLLMLVAGVVVALLAVDLMMHVVQPAPAKLQVRDGIADLRRTPDVLAISSSHGRSFDVLGDVLRKRTQDNTDLIAVALEAGKVDAMEWVLHHRVKPLILNSEGKIKSPLTHVLFGITWWDTCRLEESTETAHNIVTHGWEATDYFNDFAETGANDLNRNYVRNLWRHIFSYSALVKTRFAIRENFGRFTNFLRVLIRGELPDDEYQETLARWNADIEDGHECYLSERDVQGLDRFVEFTRTYNLDLTIVLFPLKPDTITEKGRRDTIEPFADALSTYGAENNVRVVDMTLGILSDDEFMLDLDHVNPSGNIKWSNHALDNELQFLLEAGSSGDAR